MQPKDWKTASFAQRLEYVRVNVVRTSYAEFHRRLNAPQGDGDAYSVSYAAIQNYHTHTPRADKQRVPPADYIERVCNTFDIRPAWLLRGEGSPTPADTAERDPEREALRAAILDELGIRATHAGVQWTRLALFAADHIEDDELDDSSYGVHVYRRVARALRAPLDSLGIDHTKVDALDTYLALVGGALEWAFRHSAAPSDEEPEHKEAGNA